MSKEGTCTLTVCTLLVRSSYACVYVCGCVRVCVCVCVMSHRLLTQINRVGKNICTPYI